MSAEYDIVVIGAGLIGSAAARHLVEISNNLKVLLIGPEEPQDRNSTDIFGSHYDEGRITKTLDPSPGWITLARRSLDRYRHLEQNSGINFYHEVGYLLLGYKDTKSTYDVKTAAKYGEKLTVLSHNEMREKFPYLGTRENQVGTYTALNSGFINPRQMLKAQKLLAKQGGCDVINDVVKRVDPIFGRGGYGIRLDGSDRVIKTRKVLVATGCFTHSRDLLPRGIELDINRNGTTILLAEVDETDLSRLREMPSIITEGEPGSGYVLSVYIVPPVKYPDGRYYIKIGPGRRYVAPLHNAEQLTHWYRFGHDNRQHRFLLDALHDHFPDVLFRNYKFDYCVTTSTENSHVMIDLVAPGFGVAVAGNGFAGKSADEIGHVAARMMLAGRWDYDHPHDVFKAKYKTKTSKL